jgi:hypothetical protein
LGNQNDAVAHIHGFLQERILVVLGLTVYADESGTHDEHGLQPGSEVSVVAGYIADKAGWKILTRRWNTALRKFGIEGAFHTADCFWARSPYDKWTDAKRRRCMQTFIKIARDNTWFAIGGMITTTPYDQILAPEIKDNRLGKLSFEHPYHFCFQMLFIKFMEYLKNDIDRRFPRQPGNEERVAFFFDRQKQFAPLALRNYGLIKKMIDPTDRLGALVYESKDRYIPLQAADLLAFYARRILTHQNEGKAWGDPYELMLEERHNLMLHYFTPEQMAEFAGKIAATRESLRDDAF